MVRSALVLLFSGLVFFLPASRSAFAHAILLNAAPAADSTVTGPEVAVELRFNSRIDAKRSRLSFILPDRKLLPLTIEEQGPVDTLRATAAGLKRGVYRLVWQVLASDGHISRGEVPFTVK